MRYADAPTVLDRPAPVAVRPHTGRRDLLALPARAACVPAARHWTADLLQQWGVPTDERDSAVLIVGELTANAVLHGHADMTVVLVLGRGTLGITVTDSGPAIPRPSSDIDADEHGRGTDIVRLLARWTTVHQTARGREVHAVLCWEPDPPAQSEVRPDGMPLPIPGRTAP